MKTKIAFYFLSACLIHACDSVNREKTPEDNNANPCAAELSCDPVDSLQAQVLSEYICTGISSLENFFGRSFSSSFIVQIHSHRDSIDHEWQKAWDMPTFKSECWMVASGVAHRLDILSPRIWEEQACEHNARDTSALHKLIVHELVHVFHGQQNPSPTFENIENIDWFVEGLAVYISAQLDSGRIARAREFVNQTGGPRQLKQFWKGENRYGISGSMVSYIDNTYGRETMYNLLRFTTASQCLDHLGISEDDLIRSWSEAFMKE